MRLRAETIRFGYRSNSLLSVIVVIDCGNVLRAGGYSLHCRHGANHAALLREAERELEENSVYLQYRDFGSVRLEYRDYDGEKATKTVYRANDIVTALTSESTQSPENVANGHVLVG